MNNEENNVSNYVKKITVLWIALACLGVGFFMGLLADSLFTGSETVRKMTVKQAETPPVAPAPQQTAAPALDLLPLEQAVAANPQDADAWLSLGNGYFDTNNYANAIRAYKKYLELKPGNADVLTDLGVMYRSSGNAEEALRCFDKAIEVNPRHPQSRFNKGVILMHDLKNPVAAIKAWEELVEIFPDAKTQEGMPLKEVIQKFKKAAPPVQ